MIAPLLKGDVEVDETYIGGHRTGWKGRGAGKEGVAVIVERRGRTAGYARLAVIPRATPEVLTSFVQGAIRSKEAELSPRVLCCAIEAEPFPYHRLTAERSG